MAHLEELRLRVLAEESGANSAGDIIRRRLTDQQKVASNEIVDDSETLLGNYC